MNAQREYWSLQNRPATLWHWKFKFLYAEILLLQSNNTGANALLETAPPVEFRQLSPRFKFLQGYLANRLGKFDQAEILLSQAANEARLASDFDLEADIDLLVFSYTTPEQPEKADRFFNEVIRIGSRNHLPYQTASAYINRGMLLIDQSRFAEAIPNFEKAKEIASKAGLKLVVSTAEGDLATCYYSLGKYDESLSRRMKAINLQTEAGADTWLRDSYLDLGNSQFRQHDTEHAIESFRRALVIVRAKDSAEPHARVAASLASALESVKQLDEAERLNQEARQELTSLDPQANADLLLEANISLLMNEAAIGEDRGNHDLAERDYLKAITLSRNNPSFRWSAYESLASIYYKRGDIAGARKNFEAAVATVEASRADQGKSAYQIMFLSSLIRLYQEYVDLLVEVGDKERALEVADSSRAAVLTRISLRGRNTGHHTLVPRLQKMARQGGSTFLFYWIAAAPQHSYLWVIGPDGLHTKPLDDSEKIEARIGAYQTLLERKKIDPIAQSSKAAAELFKELAGPALPFIKSTRVTIVPDGALHSLNFETLVVDQPQPHYWLEDVTVSIAPSLGILTEAKLSKPQLSSLLLFADPDFKGTGFENLPDAAEEIKSVQRYFPPEKVVLRQGSKAVPSAYAASQPEAFSDIHFATHADANSANPLDSSIVLSKENDDYRLYASKIMDIPIRTDLVTIAACHGAGSRTLSGEGSVGFAWAFFHAGARNVLAGLWDADDRSTSDLMDSFYRRVSQGGSYAEALRGAKLEMLKGHYRKPYYWAPFQLYTRQVGV